MKIIVITSPTPVKIMLVKYDPVPVDRENLPDKSFIHFG